MAAVALMDNMSNDGAREIPLECALCPKKPKFSDVSHLLTHVSSKSHLHHAFQITIRASTDADAAATKKRFDDWYGDYGIEGLLKDRIDAKDTKKPGAATRRRAVPARANGSGSSTNNTGQRQHKTRSATMEAESVKPERHPAAFAMTADMPPLGHFSTTSMNVHSLQQADHDVFFMENTGYSDLIKGEGSPFDFETYAGNTFRTGQSILRSHTQTPDSAMPSTVGTELTDETDGSSKLKGTVWPGMGMFDSATPDQKRKRNQRKGPSVLEQMKLTSRSVTSTETIYNMDLDEQRQRDIYASPSEYGSPERDIVADNHKKKRTKRTVPAPVEPPTSAPRTGLRSSARLANRTRLLDSQDVFEQPEEPESKPKKEKKPVGGRRTKKKKPEGFDVFQDPREDSPGRTESLEDETTTNRFTIPSHPAIPLADMSTNENLMMGSPTPAAKQHSARLFSSNAMDVSPFSFPNSYPSPFLPAQFSSHQGLNGSTHNPLFPQGQMQPQPRLPLAWQHRVEGPSFDENKIVGSVFPHRLAYHQHYNMGINPYTSQQRENREF